METHCRKLGRGTEPHEHVGLNLTVLKGRSVLVIGWIEGPGGPAESFGRSFADVPDEQKANMGIQLAVEHIKNIFMKPSWWCGLSDTVRDALVTRMRSGGVRAPDRPAGLSSTRRKSLHDGCPCCGKHRPVMCEESTAGAESSNESAWIPEILAGDLRNPHWGAVSGPNAPLLSRPSTPLICRDTRSRVREEAWLKRCRP